MQHMHSCAAEVVLNAALGLVATACSAGSQPALPDRVDSHAATAATDEPGDRSGVSQVIPINASQLAESKQSVASHVTGAPLAADSAQVVARLADQVASRYGGVAAFNVTRYNTSLYQVPSNTRRQDIRFDDCQNRGSEPPQLRPGATIEPFRSVPVPEGAIPTAGDDGELTIYSPETDQLWEF